MNKPLLELAHALVVSPPPPSEAPSGPFRVQCVYCHHDAEQETSPEFCPTCGDVRICVTTPNSQWQALRDRLRAEFEWKQLRERVRNP